MPIYLLAMQPWYSVTCWLDCFKTERWQLTRSNSERKGEEQTRARESCQHDAFHDVIKGCFSFVSSESWRERNARPVDLNIKVFASLYIYFFSAPVSVQRIFRKVKTKNKFSISRAITWSPSKHSVCVIFSLFTLPLSLSLVVTSLLLSQTFLYH